MKSIDRRTLPQPALHPSAERLLAAYRINGPVAVLSPGGRIAAPKGVYRFRTMDEANRQQDAWLAEAMAEARAARELVADWFEEGEGIRVADEIVVDLVFRTCGETYDSLKRFEETIDLDGVPVRTIYFGFLIWAGGVALVASWNIVSALIGVAAAHLPETNGAADP